MPITARGVERKRLGIDNHQPGIQCSGLGDVVFEDHTVSLEDAIETILRGIEGTETEMSEGRVRMLINVILRAVDALDHEYLSSDNFKWHCDVLNLDYEVLLQGIIERGDKPIRSYYVGDANNDKRVKANLARCKLSDEDIENIKASKLPRKKLAKMYGVTQGTLSKWIHK